MAESSFKEFIQQSDKRNMLCQSFSQNFAILEIYNLTSSAFCRNTSFTSNASLKFLFKFFHCMLLQKNEGNFGYNSKAGTVKGLPVSNFTSNWRLLNNTQSDNIHHFKLEMEQESFCLVVKCTLDVMN